MKRAKATSKKEVIEVTLNKDEFMLLASEVTSNIIEKFKLNGAQTMATIELMAMLTSRLSEKMFKEDEKKTGGK